MGVLVMTDLEYRFTRLILKHSLFLPLLNLGEFFLLHSFLSQFSDTEMFGILLHSKIDRMFSVIASCLSFVSVHIQKRLVFDC